MTLKLYKPAMYTLRNCIIVIFGIYLLYEGFIDRF